jgi:hypothetical protein
MISKTQLKCSLLACLAAVTYVPAQAQSTVPSNEVIFDQMVQAQAENRTHDRPYTVTRDYKLFGRESDLAFKSRVIAELTVVPPDSKKYTIEDSNGTGWGEKLVRTMLDREIAFAKDSGSTDITRDNYDFIFVREDDLSGQRCYVLQLRPKRNSKNLLRGTIWVDATTHLPRRVEGEPSESPSWWLKNVRIVILYSYVGPMWLQTSSEATGSVRILGPSTIVWQDVRYQIDESTPGASLAQAVVRGDMTAEGQP